MASMRVRIALVLVFCDVILSFHISTPVPGRTQVSCPALLDETRVRMKSRSGPTARRQSFFVSARRLPSSEASAFDHPPQLQMYVVPGCPFCDRMRGMLCFVLEDMTALRIFNVEDEAAFATTGIATIRRAEHALSKSVPQLWVVSRDGLDEELVGDGEALNDELNDGTFVQRLQRAGIPFLSQENYW